MKKLALAAMGAILVMTLGIASPAMAEDKGIIDLKSHSEVEVESLAQALAAARFHRAHRMPDMILLDNMSITDVARCVQTIRCEAGPRVLIEASGGITPETLGAYLDAGCDVASMSHLTFDAAPLDISMKLVKYK